MLAQFHSNIRFRMLLEQRDSGKSFGNGHVTVGAHSIHHHLPRLMEHYLFMEAEQETRAATYCMSGRLQTRTQRRFIWVTIQVETMESLKLFTTMLSTRI